MPSGFFLDTAENEMRQFVGRKEKYGLVMESSGERIELLLSSCELPCIVLSVHDLVSSSDLNKRIIFFKRVRDGSKLFRALRAPALS